MKRLCNQSMLSPRSDHMFRLPEQDNLLSPSVNSKSRSFVSSDALMGSSPSSSGLDISFANGLQAVQNGSLNGRAASVRAIRRELGSIEIKNRRHFPLR